MELCTVEDCENTAAKGGLCWAHVKRKQRGQAVAPSIAHRPGSAFERAMEAGIAFLDTDSEADQAAYRRARDNWRKAMKAYGIQSWDELRREGMAQARARGVHMGRPRKLAPLDAARAHQEHGSIRKAARHLGVDRMTFRRALRQVVDKP